MSELIISVAATLIATLICAEIGAWAPRVVKILLALAVSRAPSALRGRLSEEWAAYVDDIPGAFGKLLAAIGFVLAAAKMSFSARWIRATTTLSGCWALLKLAYRFAALEMSRGPIITRIPRAASSLYLAYATMNFAAAVLRPVVAGMRPPQFAINAIQGMSLLLDSLSEPCPENGKRPPWCFNRDTGELVEGTGDGKTTFTLGSHAELRKGKRLRKRPTSP